MIYPELCKYPTALLATDSYKVTEVFSDQQLALLVANLSYFVKPVSLQQWRGTCLFLSWFSLVVSLFLLYILTLSRYLVYKLIQYTIRTWTFRITKLQHIASSICLSMYICCQDRRGMSSRQNFDLSILIILNKVEVTSF